MKECPRCHSCFVDSVRNCQRDGEILKSTLPVEVFLNDRYQLIQRIGQRSVGVVYLAKDNVLNCSCAIKVILPDLIGHDHSLADRFLADATATSNITHPNILKITDSGKIGGLVPFVVMEFIDGTNLHEILKTAKHVPPARALEYMLPICSGLAIAHRRDIIHGDLKPRSILISSADHVVKISDFGMSLLKSGKLYGPQAEPKGSGMLRSPLYLSPEDWSEEKIDARSDIYSLGVMLYQMLTGDVPFKGKSSAAIMRQHLMNAPPPIAGSHGISGELEEVVMHALAKNAEDRPATVEEFVEELQFVVNDAGVATIVQPKQISFGKAAATITSTTNFGDITLVGTQNLQAEPVADLDSTVVLTRADLKTAREEIFAEPEPVATNDLEMTILPGMISASSETVIDTAPVLELPDEEVEEEPLVFIENFVDDSPPPRTVAPVLLALGVILIVVLIGVGVYYSRGLE
jgi:serine/threonine-protein kinase